MSICLDAASIRAEVAERGTFTEAQVAAFAALPDEELDSAINEVVGDAFWQFYDETRSDAIRRLLLWHKLGEENDE